MIEGINPPDVWAPFGALSMAVIQGRGNTYIYVGGSPFVKAKNLARAMQWGAYLFGGSGYAVLQPKGASPDGPFYVAHLLGSFKLRGLP